LRHARGAPAGVIQALAVIPVLALRFLCALNLSQHFNAGQALL
jgi:hypothetical protein